MTDPKLKRPRVNYKSGYRAERKAIEDLKGMGYWVIRSAKSGGPFDLVGISKSGLVLIQVKVCPFGKVPNPDRIKNELADIPAPANCLKKIWIWERRRGFHYFLV